MSNENLLSVLVNYYVQSSISCIISITENICTALIAKRLCMYVSSWVQNPRPVKSYTVQQCKGLSLLQHLS